MNERPDGHGLGAFMVNCSLKADPQESHTRLLLERVGSVLAAAGVDVDTVHALDHTIAFGMEKDLTEHGAPRDDWPDLQRRILAADIFVLGTPIWLGEKSSVASLVVERMYAYSGDLNAAGQYPYYGKAAGVVITGNEDGVKACAKDVLYAMQHVGFTVPPQADCGWIGEAGPGPSYGDEVEGSSAPAGYDNDFTNRNATFMAWNLVHTARMLREAGGFPSYGNQPDHWREVPNAADPDGSG